MTDQAGGGIEEVAARAGREAQVRHQQEEGQHAQLVSRCCLEKDHAGFDQRGFRSEQQHEADEAHHPHRHADRNAQSQQREQRENADERRSSLHRSRGLIVR